MQSNGKLRLKTDNIGPVATEERVKKRLRLYFIIVAQITQVAQSVLFKLASQHGQSGQQYRNIP